MNASLRSTASRLLLASGLALLLLAAGHYGIGLHAQTADVPAIPAQDQTQPGPEVGDFIARIEIPKVALNAAVFEGVSDSVLRKGPGHLPRTALPGRAGAYNNCVIAGHRDSFFRRLGWVRVGDRLRLTGGDGTHEYRIVERRIVLPEETGVAGPTSEPQVTLITCYPFNWIGSAPYRLVLEARLAGDARTASRGTKEPEPISRSASRLR